MQHLWLPRWLVQGWEDGTSMVIHPWAALPMLSLAFSCCGGVGWPSMQGQPLVTLLKAEYHKRALNLSATGAKSSMQSIKWPYNLAICSHIICYQQPSFAWKMPSLCRNICQKSGCRVLKKGLFGHKMQKNGILIQMLLAIFVSQILATLEQNSHLGTTDLKTPSQNLAMKIQHSLIYSL